MNMANNDVNRLADIGATLTKDQEGLLRLAKVGGRHEIGVERGGRSDEPAQALQKLGLLTLMYATDTEYQYRATDDGMAVLALFDNPREAALGRYEGRGSVAKDFDAPMELCEVPGGTVAAAKMFALVREEGGIEFAADNRAACEAKLDELAEAFGGEWVGDLHLLQFTAETFYPDDEPKTLHVMLSGEQGWPSLASFEQVTVDDAVKGVHNRHRPAERVEYVPKAWADHRVHLLLKRIDEALREEKAQLTGQESYRVELCRRAVERATKTSGGGATGSPSGNAGDGAASAVVSPSRPAPPEAVPRGGWPEFVWLEPMLPDGGPKCGGHYSEDDDGGPQHTWPRYRYAGKETK